MKIFLFVFIESLHQIRQYLKQLRCNCFVNFYVTMKETEQHNYCISNWM